jgi:sugar transferase (PEP-CTERM system associated)
MIRIFNHYLSGRLLLLTLLEASVLFGAVLIGYEIRFPAVDDLPYGEAAVFTIVMLMSMSALGMYQIRASSFATTVHRLIVAFGMSTLLMAAVFYLFPETYIGRGVLAWTSLAALVSVLLVRVAFFHLSDLGLHRRRVLVLGNGPEAEAAIQFLHRGATRGSALYAGTIPTPDEHGRRAADATGYSQVGDLLKAVDEVNASEIIVAVRERRGGVLPLRQLLECRLRGVKVMDLQSFYEREQGSLHLNTMRASWLIFGQGFDQGRSRDVVKRLFDVVVSLALIMLTFPVLLLAMLAVLLDGGRPVFYTQERVGEGGRIFRIIKLRTMRRDAEADGTPRWAGQKDARITRVGAFLRSTRLDELPQIWNVLAGDMSFVGPRPERPFFVERLAQQIPFYHVRHSIKPGITGWAQVRYTYTATVEDGAEKLQYDLYYVKNHSLLLDLLILVETVHVVLFGKGAR